MIQAKPIQKIFFGSPGTGKSYYIDNEVIPKELGINRDENPENIIKTVFHPDYSYSDFMGKLVPLTKAQQKVIYSFYEGDFMKALARAYKNIIDAHNKDNEQIKDIDNVVLVIDEINRGNSSSIFGSVFQLLDRDNNSGWSSYSININEMEFLTILELIGTKFGYNGFMDIEEYKLPPFLGVKGLATLNGKPLFKNGNLKFDLVNRKIKIPPNLSILATMNTSDSSVYHMDSAFKRRWSWEFIDIDSKPIKTDGIAFSSRKEWESFVKQVNSFIKSHYKYIRGIEDKQIGYYFINKDVIEKSEIQNKLMFFIWDSVFPRDKRPLLELLDINQNKLITFGDFVKQVDNFIGSVSNFENV